MTFQLPAGSALWQATGGPRAWSDEYAGQMATVHRLDILAWQQTEDGQKGHKQPQPAETPAWFEDVDKHEQSTLSKAQRFLALERERQRNTG